MTPRTLQLACISALFASLPLLASAQSVTYPVGPIGFDTAADYSDNFRTTFGSGAQATDSSGNGFVGSMSGPFITAYDTSPGDTTTATTPQFPGTFTLGMDVSASDAGSSFGIFLFNTSSSGTNLLVIFDIDSGATGVPGTERIRFFKNGSLSSTSAGTAYTLASGLITGSNGQDHAGTNSYTTTASNQGEMAIDSSDPFTFYHLDITYDPTGRTLSLNANNVFSATLSIPVDDVITNPGIAVRMNDSSTGDQDTQKFDNFSVVPEPGSASLLALGGLALLARRRSKPRFWRHALQ